MLFVNPYYLHISLNILCMKHVGSKFFFEMDILPVNFNYINYILPVHLTFISDIIIDICQGPDQNPAQVLNWSSPGQKVTSIHTYMCIKYYNQCNIRI